MKKNFLFILSIFFLVSCSVDKLEVEQVGLPLLVRDAIVEINGCSVTTFYFGDAGRIDVKNDLNFVYIKIIAFGNYELIQTNLHISGEIPGFPTTGNGGIITNKMEYQNSFNPPVKEYTFKFPLNSFEDTSLVGAYSVFQLGKKKYNFWAGDLTGNQWNYFKYNLYDHPFAGADNSGEISLSTARAIESWDEVRKVYTALLEPSVPRGQFIGSFQPTIKEVITRFNDPLLGGVGEYPTVYTIGKGECTDSVILTLIVVPDEN